MFFRERLFNKDSIEGKLLYSNFLIFTFAMGAMTIIMLVYQYIAIKDATLKEIHIQTDIIRDSVAAAVAFQDSTAASEALHALKSASDIIEAHLVLPNQELLASYQNENFKVKTTPISPLLPRVEERITLQTITISKPILLRSQFVGTIVAVGSLSSFYIKFYWYMSSTAIADLIAMVLGRLLAVRISKSITKPLFQLISTTKYITSNNDYNTNLNIKTSKDEVGQLAMAFEEMMSQIQKRDMSLKQLAYYDRITGLANRHYFEKRLLQAINTVEKNGGSFYLMMIDLDDFKIVNDTLGHSIGDLLLHHVGERLLHTLRSSDSIFRIGGDEFAIIIENMSDDNTIGIVAQKIIDSISSGIILDGNKVKVGASIGISQYPSSAQTKNTLISTADMAMYKAKEKGKNAYSIHKSDIKTHLLTTPHSTSLS